MDTIKYKVLSSDTEQELSLDDINDLDIVSVGVDQYHVLENGQSIKTILLSSNKESKQYSLELNGNTYNVKILDEYDLLVDKMGLTIGTHHKSGDINAPMPGLVLKLLVKEGQEVEEETPLFVLEAMKMENVIKAHRAGTIQSVNVDEGSKVEKGQLIIEIV